MLEELDRRNRGDRPARSYVCLGTLAVVHADYLEMKNADLHDLRDTETSRENYIADSIATGIKRNRKKLWLMRLGYRRGVALEGRG